MNMPTPCEIINNLHLEDVKDTMRKDRNFKKLEEIDLDSLEIFYKKFLFLMKKYPEETIVPILLVDEFWHYHIIHTKQYRDDCQKIFGKFIDHLPINNETEISDGIEKTLEKVRETFPELV